MTRIVRPSLAVATAVSLAAAVAVSTVPGAAATTNTCGMLTDPVYRLVKKSAASLVTPSKSEAAKAAAQYGFTENQGVVFRAATASGSGLVEVHRFYRETKQDFLSSADPAEWKALGKLGYVDQGRSFFAAGTASSCVTAVVRYEKADRHRQAVAATEGAGLVKDGWTAQGTSFYAAPPAGSDPAPDPGTPTPPSSPDPEPTPPPSTDTSSTFSFAVMPDTQQEVLNPKDTRFVNRTEWLAKEKAALNLKFVTHTGDVHNWDTPNHDQYAMSSKAMTVLENAHIPYSLAIGNHDTEATGVGGAARPGGNTRAKQRDTSTFNSYYDAARYGGVSGVFEKNKVDNVYSLYNAGGKKFMVMVLEMWPRKAVVEWAKDVVASHPDYNVIIATHDYLSSSSKIEQKAPYGDTTPQQLFTELVSQYANIKIVVSGHVGFAGSRVDTGVHGNKIYDFMTTIHSTTTNPTRMFTIDTKAGTIKTWIYCPSLNLTYTAYSKTVKGVTWVK